jgi:hypothetical protein
MPIIFRLTSWVLSASDQDHDVNGAEAILRGGGRGLERLRVSDIGYHREHLHARRLGDFMRRFFELFLAASEQDEVHSFRGQPSGDGSADALASAGDGGGRTLPDHRAEEAACRDAGPNVEQREERWREIASH